MPSESTMPSGERWVVLGISGAGKSTLARALAQARGVPHIELDALYWGPNWTPTEQPVVRERTAAAVRGAAWVVDGNYSSLRDIVWPRATTAVWLNYPFPTVLWRVFLRCLRRIARRETLWHGNRESFTRTFCSRESILWWVVTAYARRQREYAQLKAAGAYPHLTWIELRRAAQARALLESVRQGGAPAAATTRA